MRVELSFTQLRTVSVQSNTPHAAASTSSLTSGLAGAVGFASSTSVCGAGGKELPAVSLLPDAAVLGRIADTSRGRGRRSLQISGAILVEC